MMESLRSHSGMFWMMNLPNGMSGEAQIVKWNNGERDGSLSSNLEEVFQLRILADCTTQVAVTLHDLSRSSPEVCVPHVVKRGDFDDIAGRVRSPAAGEDARQSWKAQT